MTMRSRLWVFYTKQKRRIDGALILVAAIAVTVWIGVISSSKTSPPSASELTVLLFVAAALQVWAGATFGRIGHVDPDKAKSAVRRLISIGIGIGELRSHLVGSESEPLQQLRVLNARIEQGLTILTREVEDAVSDWNDVHAEALQNVLEELQSQPATTNKGDRS